VFARAPARKLRTYCVCLPPEVRARARTHARTQHVSVRFAYQVFITRPPPPSPLLLLLLLQ